MSRENIVCALIAAFNQSLVTFLQFSRIKFAFDILTTCIIQDNVETVISHQYERLTSS